jgi:dihydroflavonol-4-reductase
MMAAMVTPSSTVVCVTGAAGYIGSHLVRELLERGYRVRAAVRDADDESQTAHLGTIAGDAADRLELVSANLLERGAYDEAVAGCDHVYHLASAVRLTARDPQRDIVDPAVIGTENVFAAIARAGTVRAVGLTSSIAAITSSRPRPGHIYSEDDWVEDATLSENPYGLAKRRAEKAAWEARERLAEDERYALAVVNPVLVVGPAYARAHLRSSASVIRSLMKGSFRGCPNLSLGLVDVRDVAVALIAALERGTTDRFILHRESLWMREIAETIAAAFPERKVPTRRLPDAVVYAAALFDKRLSWSFLRRNLGRQDRIENSKARRELGLELRDVRASIIETCRSFIEHGLV